MPHGVGENQPERRPIFSIGAVSRMLDIAPATLRTWEDRYDVVTPGRTPSGRRLYSRDQVEQLRFVKARVAEGMQAAEAHRLLADLLAGGGLASAPVESLAGARLLVLVAERDPYAADLIAHFLRDEGYEVEIALDVVEARRRIEASTPHLAIVELLLADGSGQELCRLAKDRGVASVVAVSTLSAREQALEAGADAFLAKPLDPRELVSTVRSMLATPDSESAESPA
jgi:CheY-like chemotaxis protein